MREELRSLTVGFRPFRVNNVDIIDASALLLLRADKHLEYSEIDCGADIRNHIIPLTNKTALCAAALQAHAQAAALHGHTAESNRFYKRVSGQPKISRFPCR